MRTKLLFNRLIAFYSFHALVKLSCCICNILFYKKTMYIKRTLPFELNKCNKMLKTCLNFPKSSQPFFLSIRSQIAWNIHMCKNIAENNFLLFLPLNEWMSEPRSQVFKFSANWYLIFIFLELPQCIYMENE